MLNTSIEDTDAVRAPAAAEPHLYIRSGEDSLKKSYMRWALCREVHAGGTTCFLTFIRSADGAGPGRVKSWYDKQTCQQPAPQFPKLMRLTSQHQGRLSGSGATSTAPTSRQRPRLL